MSSFVGHGLVGFSVSKMGKNKFFSFWTGWFLFLAILPDLSYLELWAFDRLFIFKYSHSIGFIFPFIFLTILFLKFKKDKEILVKSIQTVIASSSHLLLDLLVGVYPKPYFWPFYEKGLKLNFGILPSAGKLDLHNYYLYKNLFIELGILIPFIFSISLILNYKKVKYFFLKQLFLICVLIYFVSWGMSLNR